MKKVAFVMGSESDRAVVESAVPYLEYFGIPYEFLVISAHRNPGEISDFARQAQSTGYGVLVGCAGMAAHLAGALKSHSILPVIGVPLPGGLGDGLDALLSTVQMPKGVPVATMSVGKAGAINAAILAAEIFALESTELQHKLHEFKNHGARL